MAGLERLHREVRVEQGLLERLRNELERPPIPNAAAEHLFKTFVNAAFAYRMYRALGVLK